MWVHGDDFVPLGYIVNVKCFFCETARGWGCHDIPVLGRIVEWTDDGITWEADLRHAELIRKSFGVTSHQLTHLASETSSMTFRERFRSARKRQIGIVPTPCVHSISPVDRPEIQVEFRDVARNMQQPSNLDEMGLKRLAPISECVPRLVWLFKWPKACHTYRILVRHGSCWLYSNQEECFWLCVGAG